MKLRDEARRREIPSIVGMRRAKGGVELILGSPPVQITGMQNAHPPRDRIERIGSAAGAL
jgi:hypothetical protein